VAWWHIGRFGAFHPEGHVYESRSSRHVYGPLANPSIVVAFGVTA